MERCPPEFDARLKSAASSRLPGTLHRMLWSDLDHREVRHYGFQSEGVFQKPVRRALPHRSFNGGKSIGDVHKIIN